MVIRRVSPCLRVACSTQCRFRPTERMQQCLVATTFRREAEAWVVVAAPGFPLAGHGRVASLPATLESSNNLGV